MNMVFDSGCTPADIYESIGLEAYEYGDLDGARLMFETSVEHAEKDELAGERLLSKLNNLAIVYDQLDMARESDFTFQRAITRCNDDLGFDHKLFPKLLRNYAILLARRDDSLLAEGVEACAEAMELSSFRNQPYQLFNGVIANETHVIERVA